MAAITLVGNYSFGSFLNREGGGDPVLVIQDTAASLKAVGLWTTIVKREVVGRNN